MHPGAAWHWKVLSRCQGRSITNPRSLRIRWRKEIISKSNNVLGVSVWGLRRQILVSGFERNYDFGL